MKWKLLLMMIFICFNTICSAERRKPERTHNSEFEVAIGGISGLKNDFGAYPRIGGQILFEYRYNIPGNNLSLGTQCSLGYFNRIDYNIDRRYKISNKGSMVTYLDYNFRLKERVSIFTGIGVGLAAIDYEYPQWISDNTYEQEYLFSRSAVVTPRVGVEFLKRLRLTVEYRLMRKDYSYFGVNLGFSIGGR